MTARRLLACAVLSLLAGGASGGAAAQAPPSGPDFQCLTLTQLPVARAVAGTRLDQLVERLPEALKACEEGIRIRPNEARMHAMLARVRALAGDRAGAIAEARRAVELRASESEAVLLLGTLQARDDPAAALRQFRHAARLGEKIATYNLGVLWANGLGAPRDPQDAANFFRDAARAGDTVAMLVIGQLTAQGIGAPQDRQQAEDWWRKAAESGQPEAVPDPARLVLGEPVLDTRALTAFYLQQAQAGRRWAQAWIGLLYDIGLWFPRDRAAAAFWYAKAGQAGDRDSQYRLATMYRLGLGVPQDLAESRRWAAMPQQAFCEQELQKMSGADDCDRLAGDPYQPGRTVAGLHTDCVVPHAQAAAAACRRAVARHPGELRFQAQYARALALANHFEDAAREARSAATKGSTPAMVLLGVMNQRGLGMPRDGRAALAWYRRAAEAGDPRGSALVLAAAREGVGVEPGSSEAKELAQAESARLFRRAQPAPDPVPARAAQGDVRAQFELALRYEGQKNYPAAIEWYARAARQGDAAAAMALAQMHENGIGMPKDRNEAIAAYTALADEGHAEARYRLAVLQAESGNMDEAVKRLRKSVEHDDYRAMLDLGEDYENGRGVPQDSARAVPLYERAADRSNWARARLGAMALAGTGMARDPAKARRWLEPAAADGDHSALNNLGVMAERGLGQPEDFVRARDMYLKALYGTPQARGNLEHLYESDTGAPHDPAALADWYRPAANAGIAAAQWRLGRLYLQGRGVARDEQEAVRWLGAAAEQGHAAAQSDAGRAYYALAQKYAHGDGVNKDERAEMEALLSAASYGEPAAIAALAARAPAALPFVARQGPKPKLPAFPAGIAPRPDDDAARGLQLRIASVGSIQAGMADAGIASVYTVIPWTGIDERNRASPHR